MPLYLGATARVTSIVKNTTESANASPLHEMDKSMVNAADVKAGGHEAPPKFHDRHFQVATAM